MAKNTSVFGIYKTRDDASNAVEALRLAGFRNTDISALLPDNVGTKDFAVEMNTKAPEGAATGASAGALLGGTLGWLAGIGALAIPGVGPFIAAGPIMGALREWALVPSPEASLEHLPGTECPSTKPSALRDGSRTVPSYSPFIAIAPAGLPVPRAFWRRRGRLTFPPREASADFSVTDKPMARANFV